MFERFTDRARRVLMEGQSESTEGRHGFLGTEHILIGILRLNEGMAFDVLTQAGVAIEPLREKVNARLAEWVDPNRGSVTDDDALASIGIDLQSVKASVESTFGAGALPDPFGTPAFTPKAKDSLEHALRYAIALRHRYIGTEHLLLGVLDARDGVGCQALTDLGVDIDQVVEKVKAAAAPEQTRVNTAWSSIYQLRAAVAALPDADAAERARPILQDLGSAHAEAVRVEQTAGSQLATDLASALEAAVGGARARLKELDLEV